jgi:hypothetical protein
MAGNEGVVLVPYNGTGQQGADPLTMDVNIWYEVSLVPPNEGPRLQRAPAS